MGEFICKMSGTGRPMSLPKYQLPFPSPFDSTSLTLSANTRASFSKMLLLNGIDSSGSLIDFPYRSRKKDANCLAF